MLHVIIHTDGSCRSNPGPGGWGAILRAPKIKKQKKLMGAHPETTNNRMEMMAAVGALRFLRNKGKCKVELYTDSQYLKKGMTEWMRGWKRRNFQTSTGSPVKNGDLWKVLDELSKQHDITWNWVRGHNGDKYNEIADRLANEGAVQAGYYKD